MVLVIKDTENPDLRKARDARRRSGCWPVVNVTLSSIGERHSAARSLRLWLGATKTARTRPRVQTAYMQRPTARLSGSYCSAWGLTPRSSAGPSGSSVRWLRQRAHLTVPD